MSLGPTRTGRRFVNQIRLQSVRWDVIGIRVLYWRVFEEYFIYDVSRGAETRLAFDLREGQGGPGFAEAWSEDGSKLAFRSSSGRAAFAPDGKRIAYILGGRIYMQEIP